MQIAAVTLNLVLFVALGVYALLISRGSPTNSIRRLWRLSVLPVAAVVLGGVQRLGIHAVRVGWLPGEALAFLLEPWQIVQSGVVAVIGVFTFVGMRRLAGRMFDLEIVVGDMVDRVECVRLEDLQLTPREREVLNVIANSTHIDDKTLSEKLSVSPDTAHSHVSSLLRKTKLRDRRDLIVLGFMLKAKHAIPGQVEDGRHPNR